MLVRMDTLVSPARFEDLTPELILGAVEKHCSVFLDGSITPYNSYINRVFGLKDEDENAYIVKFYRPGRWSQDCIRDEHAFLADCAEAEIPVVPPLRNASGDTLGSTGKIAFAVFPRIRARTFDIAGDADFLRAGSVIGRMHRAAGVRAAPHRLSCTPADTTARYIRFLVSERLVHPDLLESFNAICSEALGIITPLFDGIATHRIHGDCHRGNILESATREITLLDFDDMMTGPAVQDLWLLLSGHLPDSTGEMNLLIEGYEQFLEFDRRSLRLVEPLRFMRHIYFLNWCAVQHEDAGFAERYPDWGTKAFWITETEDLAYQLDYLRRCEYI
jgi:Ser/Thr protein kinase RdoA (MazF antagonist)